MTLAQQLKSLALKLRDERSKRWEVENSEGYEQYQKQINELQEQMETIQSQQKLLFDDVPDSTEEYEAVKRMLLGEMREKNIREIEGVKAKVKQKKEVDTRRVMEVLGGDLDNFFLMAKIQQNTLKDYGKANPELKRDLNSCIEIVSEEIVDLEVSLPE